MHILFVCRSFHNMAGGVEFSASQIMNEMIARGHTVSLITWDQKNPQPFFPLSSDINWHVLDLGDPHAGASFSLKIKRLLKLRSLIKATNADCICAFHDSCWAAALISAFGIQTPVIAAERSSLSRFDQGVAGNKKTLLLLLLRLASHIVVFFERYKEDYPASIRRKITAIPNMVFPVSPSRAKKEKRILYVGRLSSEKNPQVLIRAFALIHEKVQDWTLHIAGDGSVHSEIESLIADYDLGDKVTLHGAVKDVDKLYNKAQIFCFPSRWEGFGNALAAALAHGLCCIGFAQCCGTRDLIAHGHNGLLAEGNGNPETLSRALLRACEDDHLREKLGANAKTSMIKFEPESVFNQWEDLFLKVGKHHV